MSNKKPKSFQVSGEHVDFRKFGDMLDKDKGFDCEARREQGFGVNFSNLSVELNDTKKVEVNGRTKADDSIDIRGEDSSRYSVPLPISLPFPMNLFGKLAPSYSRDKTVSVDLNKRN